MYSVRQRYYRVICGYQFMLLLYTLGELHVHLNVFVNSRDPQCIVQTWRMETTVNGDIATWNGEWGMRNGVWTCA